MKNKASSASRFYKHIIVSSLIVFILGFYPVSVYVSDTQFYSIISGYVLGLLNAIAGYYLNTMALNKSIKSFMVLVFGGMGLRMIFIAIVILCLLYFAGLDEVSLVASVFGFYILFVIIELYHLHKRQMEIKLEMHSANK